MKTLAAELARLIHAAWRGRRRPSPTALLRNVVARNVNGAAILLRSFAPRRPDIDARLASLFAQGKLRDMPDGASLEVLAEAVRIGAMVCAHAKNVAGHHVVIVAVPQGVDVQIQCTLHLRAGKERGNTETELRT